MFFDKSTNRTYKSLIPYWSLPRNIFNTIRSGFDKLVFHSFCIIDFLIVQNTRIVPISNLLVIVKTTKSPHVREMQGRGSTLRLPEKAPNSDSFRGFPFLTRVFWRQQTRVPWLKQQTNEGVIETTRHPMTRATG